MWTGKFSGVFNDQRTNWSRSRTRFLRIGVTMDQSDVGVCCRIFQPLYMEAGMICETGETEKTGENAVVGEAKTKKKEQNEFLTGLTVSPVSPLFPYHSRSQPPKRNQ